MSENRTPPHNHTEGESDRDPVQHGQEHVNEAEATREADELPDTPTAPLTREASEDTRTQSERYADQNP